ncbi:MAG: HAD family hydrolase [Candidatus Tectomicrobia bacterium]|nr:HAD family hydrolase [Candidatus Tectomicrobia bacterium]
MSRYTTVVLDLFDTVVNFVEEKMPLSIIAGEPVRTTSGEIYPLFAGRYPGIINDPVGFHRTWVEVSKEVWAEREALHVEQSSHERFQRFAERLGLPASNGLAGLIDAAVERHMRLLINATEFPAGNRALLEQLRGAYRLGLLSNFDHTPAVDWLLANHGLEGMFEAIIVSVELRIRKPKREIFEAMLEKLGVSARETLFVGDTFRADVVGAKAAGMDVAWLNAKGREPDDPGVVPEYTIGSLPELRGILFAQRP